MNRPRPAPRWWAFRAVGLAARVLPAAQRSRYRQEFEGELYGMPPSRQFRHVAGVLTHSPALRAALVDLAPPATVTATVPWIRRVCCRLGLHRTRLQYTDDGGRYARCRYCGHDQYRPLGPRGGLTGPL